MLKCLSLSSSEGVFTAVVQLIWSGQREYIKQEDIQYGILLLQFGEPGGEKLKLHRLTGNSLI